MAVLSREGSNFASRSITSRLCVMSTLWEEKGGKDARFQEVRQVGDVHHGGDVEPKLE